MKDRARAAGYSMPLRVVKVGWVVGVGLLLALYVLALPYMYRDGQVVCDRIACPNGQITPRDLQQFQQLGLSLHFYAAYTTMLNVVYTLVFSGVAALIFWRRPDDRMALYASLALILFATAVFINPLDNLKADVPQMRLPLQLLQVAAPTAFVSFFYLFPDGRFVPRWTVWLIPLVAAREGVNVFAPELLGPDLFFVLELASIIFAQVYRYRRVSSPLQRQQTKWAVFGMVTVVGAVLVLVYGGFLLFGELSGLGFLVFPTVMYAVLMILPLSFGMAIRRSHLWDIDILIRRTLIYAALTVTLGLLYGVSVVVLQQIYAVLTGQRESAVIIVISTLAIAALFAPLRRLVQRGIDRRFYRQRYDSEKVLGSFSAITQNEVDLPRLADGLMRTVEMSVQPESLSLWIHRTGSGEGETK